MPYNHVEIRKFLGLYLDQNSFSVPDGALEQALNCVIAKDGVIEKRRGYTTFFTPSSGTLNSTHVYQDKLLCAYGTKLAYYNEAGTETTLSGVTVSVTGTRTARSVQTNNNFYLTTDNGPLKLEAYNGSIYQAGIPPALDIRGKFAQANGPINGDTQVAYRVVFLRRDGNTNVVVGAPSDFLVLINRKATSQAFALVSNVVTVTTSTPHNLLTGMTVTVSNPSATVTANTYVITVTGASSFTFAFTAANATGTLDWSATRNSIIEFSLPSEITVAGAYSWQLYRSSQSPDSLTVPSVDFKLVTEATIGSSDITAGMVFYTDSLLDLFVASAQELYTNPNSQQGELQAATRPPLCDDVCLFKNQLLYAATTSRPILFLNLTSSSVISSGDYYEIQVGSTTRRYVARTGMANYTVPGESVSVVTTTVTVTVTGHGLSTGDVVLVSNVTGTLTAGQKTITVTGANTFTFACTNGQTCTALDVQGLTNGTYPIFQLVPPGTSVSAGIDSTARGLVKAINRDASSPVYARYISGVTDVPGKMFLQGKGFAGPVLVRASATTPGSAFSPVLPTSFGSVSSTQDVLPNTVYVSKVGEPEAVPLTNSIPVGSRGKRILRIFALKDSVLVLKEDGVFRIDGDRFQNMAVTIVDATVFCQVANSAAYLNNEVYFLSNQGVVSATNASTRIVSKTIEDPLSAILGYSQLATVTAAASYESERLYLLTTLQPNTTSASVVYAYNAMNNTWTTWDTYFTSAIVGPSNTFYMISTANKIMQERKSQSRLDYAGASHAISAVSVSSDLTTAVMSSPTYTPQSGDIVVSGSVINRIVTSVSSGANYTVTFAGPTNLAAAGSYTIYEGYQSVIKLAPYHAGTTSRKKQFAQMQIHTRDNSLTTLQVVFATDSFGSSEVMNWTASSVASGLGWGQLPWGFFAWGLSSGLNLNYQTTPAPIVRGYVPLFAQRTTFIQPILTHTAAGEIMNIQSLGFAVRGYGERDSK